MNATAIREVMGYARPFLLKAADGSQYHVEHPDFISITNTKGEDGIVFITTDEGFAMLDLPNVTAIESVPPNVGVKS